MQHRPQGRKVYPAFVDNVPFESQIGQKFRVKKFDDEFYLALPERPTRHN